MKKIASRNGFTLEKVRNDLLRRNRCNFQLFSNRYSPGAVSYYNTLDEIQPDIEEIIEGGNPLC